MSNLSHVETIDNKAYQIATPCLLCGEDIILGSVGCFDSRVPRICDDCKELWKKLKEANDD